jgi:hypothetical protein
MLFSEIFHASSFDNYLITASFAKIGRPRRKLDIDILTGRPLLENKADQQQ